MSRIRSLSDSMDDSGDNFLPDDDVLMGKPCELDDEPVSTVSMTSMFTDLPESNSYRPVFKHEHPDRCGLFVEVIAYCSVLSSPCKSPMRKKIQRTRHYSTSSARQLLGEISNTALDLPPLKPSSLSIILY